MEEWNLLHAPSSIGNQKTPHKALGELPLILFPLFGSSLCICTGLHHSSSYVELSACWYQFNCSDCHCTYANVQGLGTRLVHSGFPQWAQNLNKIMIPYKQLVGLPLVFFIPHCASVPAFITLLHLLYRQYVGISFTVAAVTVHISAIVLPLKYEAALILKVISVPLGTDLLLGCWVTLGGTVKINIQE